MINVVDVPDPGSISDVFELGLILPVPGVEKNTLVMEPRDGRDVKRFTATAVEFKTNGRTVFRDRKVKIDVFVTDARFAVACSKFDKGGGWVGSGGFMVVANSVSKARAVLRSRGRMLVGQVRYPWIRRVGSSPKTGWASEEKLVFETSAGKGGDMQLTLTLPKNVDAGLVAAEIAKRAAAYRLAAEDAAADARARLEAMASSPPAPTEDGGVRYYALPEPHVVGEDSARLQPRAVA